MNEYQKTNWINTSTRVNAVNMNHIEDGIEAVTDKVTELESDKVSTADLEENYYNIDEAETAFANKHNTEEALALLGRNKADADSVATALNQVVLELGGKANSDDVNNALKEKADKDSINIYGYKPLEAEREHCFYSTTGVKTSNDNYSSIKIDCALGDKFYVTGYCMYSSQPLVVYFGAEGFIGYEPFAQSTSYRRKYIEITDERCKSVAFSSYNKPGSSVAQYLLCSKYGLLGSSLENAYLLAPMRGKSIYFDGDSVAVGFGSHNYSYADIIADKYEMQITQKAASGTYLCTGVKANSIYERVMDLNPATDNYDYIVLEGGFNDVFHFNSGQFGELSDSYTDTFDSTKTVSAFEGICQHLTLNFTDSKKLFILGHRKVHVKYTALQNELWDLLIEVCRKWGIPYIDLRSETSLGAYNDELAAQWFDGADGTHPNLSAYEKFYVPIIEAKLKSL